jgi:hypothetical protein
MGFEGKGFLMGDLDETLFRAPTGSDLNQHRGGGEGFAAEGVAHVAALERDGTLKTPVEAREMAGIAFSLVMQDRAFWQARALQLQRERDTLLDQIAASLVEASKTEHVTRVDECD